MLLCMGAARSDQLIAGMDLGRYDVIMVMFDGRKTLYLFKAIRGFGG